MQESLKISAYILACNERDRILHAIGSLDFVDDIVVLDNGSSDGTQQVARELGARVIEIPFKGFGPMRNTALQHCKHDWVLCLDADETITPALRQEILSLFSNGPKDSIYCAPRRNSFMGRSIQYSGWYPDYRHPLLFQRSQLVYTEDAVHETFVTQEKVSYLKSDIAHVPYRDLAHLLAKTNQYSSLSAERLRARGRRGGLLSALGHSGWAFCKQYLLRRGFLDGKAGFVLACNAAYVKLFAYLKCAELSHQNKDST